MITIKPQIKSSFYIRISQHKKQSLNTPSQILYYTVLLCGFSGTVLGIFGGFGKPGIPAVSHLSEPVGWWCMSRCNTTPAWKSYRHNNSPAYIPEWKRRACWLFLQYAGLCVQTKSCVTAQLISMHGK